MSGRRPAAQAITIWVKSCDQLWRRLEVADPLAHRPRIEIVADEQEGRLIDDSLVRLRQQADLFRLVEGWSGRAWQTHRNADR